MHKNFGQYISFKIFYKLLAIFIIQLQTYIIYAQVSSQDINKIRTVVIDPGHGGKDPGALGKHSKEKEIVLAISLKAGEYIKEHFPDVNVLYTRDKDTLIALNERPKIANEANADLFISVHANWNKNPKAYGSETYVMGLHKTQGNLEVAKKENSVITYEENYEMKYEGFDPNDVESYIMISIVQDTYLDYSLTAASLVQNQFKERVKRKDRGVKQAGFWVLWKTSMPSILIETGFISNENEEAFLLSEQGQDYLASAIFRAFRDYKKRIEGNAGPIIAPVAEENTTSDQAQGSVIEDSTTEEKSQKEKKAEAIKLGEDKKTKTIQQPVIHTESATNTNDQTKFKVQILNSENQVSLSNELFKDFNDVEEIATTDTYKYVVGSANSYKEALEYSKWVKSRYPDAFIVAVSQGKIVPLSDALKETKN